MKWKSRKFWICVAAFLGSIGTSVAALHTGNEIVSAIGVVCAIFSAAIYSFCEAWVDSKAVGNTKVSDVLKDAFDKASANSDVDED